MIRRHATFAHGQGSAPQHDDFTGDQKHLDHFLFSYERKLLGAFLPLVPLKMSTVHLTLMTVAWSGFIILFGYLSARDLYWLWGTNACIFLQHVTDMLDGEIGRKRNEGLIKWGFYMDHFLDYVFLCSIVIGYSFILPLSYSLLVLLCLTISAGFMIHTFMDFSITKDLKISFNRFGVAEVRYILILFNILLMIVGRELLVAAFPWVVLTGFFALAFVVYKSQGIYRRLDRLQMKQDQAYKAKHRLHQR